MFESNGVHLIFLVLRVRYLLRLWQTLWLAQCANN